MRAPLDLTLVPFQLLATEGKAVRWWEDPTGRGGEGMVMERFVRRESLRRVQHLAPLAGRTPFLVSSPR